MARKKKDKYTASASAETKIEKRFTNGDVRFSHLHTKVKDVIYRMSLPDGVYEYVSPAIVEVLGYTPEEFYNSPVLIRDVIHPDWRPYFAEQWQNLIAGNMPEFYEYQIIHRSGDVRWMHQSNVLVRDGNGAPAAIEGIVRDITRQKQTEEDNRVQKEFFQSILDAVKDTVFVFDPTTRKLILWNQAFRELSGFSDEDIRDRKVFEDWYGKEDIMLGAAALEKVISVGHAIVEMSLICKNGRRVPTEYHVSLIKDNEGNPKQIISVGRDLSERQRAEAEKQKLEEQLRQAQKMEAIGALAGGIAHDFNNILAVIMGYTEISLSKYAQDNRLVKNLGNILKSAHRAKDMVQQILMFSRRNETTKKLMDMGEIIHEAVTFLRSSLPTTIEIRSYIEEDGTPVMANATQIHQVVINLCTNAAYAMKDKAGLLTVILKEIVLDRDSVYKLRLKPGRYQHLSVSDTGVGMSKELMDRIFEPYFTTKKAGDGTGMGLAVVHGIVKNHGGEISVYSEWGKGSTFNVFLPIMDMSPGQIEPDEREADIRGGSERILLVDDETELAAMSAEMLRDLGYSVTACTGSSAALDHFKENPEGFDLLVTDMTMPNLTGIELAAEIRRIKPGLPVILNTGFSDRINQDNLNKHGIGGFVTKPVTKSEIARVIRDVLENPSPS